MIWRALGLLQDLEEGREDWKNQIAIKWEASKKMPRKKKKKVRKELLIDWSIANYDPFETLFN